MTKSVVQTSYTNALQIKSNVHIFKSLSNCEIVEMIDKFPVYIKTMQSCSSMFDTSSQSFQRQDDQEVDAHHVSFLSEADEMHTRK